MPREGAGPQVVTIDAPSGAPRLEAEAFADVEAVAKVSNNLPVPISSFYGRQNEARSIAEALAQSRLVTITGPGGLGKTSLAVRVAASSAPNFPDGLWFVDLGAIGDPGLVPHAVASAVGLREASPRDVIQPLLAHLRPRRLLLILDNCEHVLKAAAELGRWALQAGPGVSVLATSREPLGIVGEYVISLTPLAVPRPGEDLPSTLQEYDSVKLFLDRARWAGGGFTLDEATAPAIAEICRRLEGIPLAIELAAARARALSPGEILAKLEDRFEFLRAGDATGPERHRTLEATVEWSFNLLSEEERLLFLRLSVFTGAFYSDSARAICGAAAVKNGAVPGLIERLVAKSLLIAETAGGATRYRMLDAIREYAAAKLDPEGEAELRNAHAGWYAGLAERAAGGLAGAEQQMWLDRLGSEYDDLRAALNWALQQGDGDKALRLASSLAGFWRVRGQWSEGREWLSRALEAGADAAPSLRAPALWALGLLAGLMGDLQSGTRAAEESLVLYRELGDASGAARALSALASLWVVHQPPNALPLAEESITLAQQTGDKWCLAESLALAGQARMLTGQLAEGERLFQESLEVAESQSDKKGIARALLGVGWARMFHDTESARGSFEEGLKLAEALGERYEVAQGLMFLSDLARTQGDAGRARGFLHEALTIAQEVGSPLLTARALISLGGTAVEEGHLGAAQFFFDEAISTARTAQLDFSLIRALLGRGETAGRQGDMEEAQRFSGEALEVARATSNKWGTALALLYLAVGARKKGDDREAANLYQEALTLAAEVGDLGAVASALSALASLFVHWERYAPAARLFGASHAIAAASFGGAERALKAHYESDLDLIRRSLDDEEFRAATAQGAQMSVEEAIAYAGRGRGARGERPKRGWEALTKAERDVIALVGEGLTNAEIAERLYISPRTVSTHLSHIHGKVGTTSRRELMRLAAQRANGNDG